MNDGVDLNRDVNGCLRLNPGVLWQVFGLRVVVLHLDRKCYYSFDEMGTQVWLILVAAENVEQGIQQIYEQYDVNINQLREDILSFCEHLSDLEIGQVETI